MKADILNQDSTYRRGLVLGLTMAEIMVLILFALLLAMAASFETTQKELDRLRAVETAINDAFRGQRSNMTAKQLVDMVEKQQATIANQQRQIDRGKEAAEKAAVIDDIFQALKKAGVEPEPKKYAEMIQLASAVTKSVPTKDGAPPSPTQITDALSKYQGLQSENLNLRGQNVQLTDRISRLEGGKGNEFPSCWATPDGKAESIFELLFSTTGVTVTNRALAHRQQDQAMLPLGNVRYDIDLPLEEFKAQLQPLYRWSVREKCRFYVIRHSAEKATRNDLINAVGGYFYPDTSIIYKPKN
jgi:hypothetical protein